MENSCDWFERLASLWISIAWIAENRVLIASLFVHTEGSGKYASSYRFVCARFTDASEYTYDFIDVPSRRSVPTSRLFSLSLFSETRVGLRRFLGSTSRRARVSGYP